MDKNRSNESVNTITHSINKISQIRTHKSGNNYYSIKEKI